MPEQPVFYPVLSEDYAVEIASRWNTGTADGRGYVTRFALEDGCARRFEIHTVGAARHRELWVPAEELAEFNRHIVGEIEVIREFAGDGRGEKE